MSSRSFFKSALEAEPEGWADSTSSGASSWWWVLRRSCAWIAMSASYPRVSAPRMADAMTRNDQLELVPIDPRSSGNGVVVGFQRYGREIGIRSSAGTFPAQEVLFDDARAPAPIRRSRRAPNPR